MQVSGKVAAVVGGGDGIGRQVVVELLRRGARVAAIDLREAALEATVAAASAPAGRLVTLVADVTDRERVAALPDEVAAALGPVDLVVTCAGIIQPFERVVDLGFDAIDRVVDVNLHGTINVVKAFLPHLLERPAAHLVTVASMGAFLPVPGQAVYGATKAAVKLLTEALYAELLGTDVGVSVVMPGAVGTEITTNSGVAIPGMDAATADDGGRRTTTPQQAAVTILDGVAAGDLHVFVGTDARLMNLASRVAPKQATKLITRQMGDLLEP